MINLGHQSKATSMGIKKAAAIISVALLVVAIVWSVFQRHIAAIREQAEEQALERLIIDTKLLNMSSEQSFQLGQQLSYELIEKHSMSLASNDGSLAVNALKKRINKELSEFDDKFSWTLFSFSAEKALSREFLEEDHFTRVASGGQNGFSEKVLSWLMLKGVAILADYKPSGDLSFLLASELPARLDERTSAEQARLICSSVRTFQSLIVDKKQYQMMWVPIFTKKWYETRDFSRQSSADGNLEFNRHCLIGLLAIVYDEANYESAAKKRLLNSIQRNFRRIGCHIALGSPEGRDDSWSCDDAFNKDHSLSKVSLRAFKGVGRAGNWLLTDAIVMSLQNRKAVIARPLRGESISVRILRKLIFLTLLCWFSSIVYVCGNHLVLRRKITVGIRLQLVLIVAIFLFPAFLLGYITTERYFDSRQNASMHSLKKRIEEAVLGFDNSIRHFQLNMCTSLEQISHSLFESSGASGTASMGNEEKLKLLGNYQKQILANGVNMRNLMLVEKNGDVVARLRGGNDSETRFFRELFAAIFSPALKALNFQEESADLSDKKKLMVKAQADEVLELMKNLLPQELFLAISNKFSSLDQIEGLGDRAFVFHRYIRGNKGPDGVTMMTLYPPSIECACLNSWVNKFSDSLLGSTRWLVKLKVAPNWYLRQPYQNTYREIGFGLLRFDYDFLPWEIAFWGDITARSVEPMSLELELNREKFLFSTFPGRNLIDYQLSAIVPLEEHRRNLNDFKMNLRIAMLTVFAICALVGWYLATGFLLPLNRFALTADSIMSGNLAARLGNESTDDEFLQITQEFNNVANDVESGRILRKFISAGALRAISSAEHLSREVSVCSTDAIVVFIRLDRFWKVAAKKVPEESVFELNRFFALVCSEIHAAGGEVSKFIGEKAMATFFCSEPGQYGNRAQAVLRAIIGIVARYRLLSNQCPLRVGIASGLVRSGIIGSDEARLEQTVIGDVVNLAARLCSLPVKHSVLLCPHTAEMIVAEKNSGFEHLKLQKLPGQKIKGKSSAVDVYTIARE